MSVEQILFAPADAAKILNVSRSMVYILLSEGKLKSVHIGRSRRIHIDEIHRFISDLETQSV